MHEFLTDLIQLHLLQFFIVFYGRSRVLLPFVLQLVLSFVTHLIIFIAVRLVRILRNLLVIAAVRTQPSTPLKGIILLEGAVGFERRA